MPSPIDTFTVRTTAGGGTRSSTVRPSPLASLGLILAALVALPIAILLVGLVIVLVLLLAVVLSVVGVLRRIGATFGGDRHDRPRGDRRSASDDVPDPEVRVNVRVRRPQG